MQYPKKTVLFIAFFAGLLLIFSLSDMLQKDVTFSESENRILAKAPEFSIEALLKGEFTKNYETYLNDQFFLRNQCVLIKTYADIGLQKKEVKGVYFGKNGGLLPRYVEADYKQEQIDDKIKLLGTLTDQYSKELGQDHVRVMLIPTADNILTDQLPDFAPYFDQKSVLKAVKERIGEEVYVDTYSILKEHKDEKIYYTTDHHWTTLGAYYGFRALGKTIDIEVPPLERYQVQTVTNGFLGTLHSKINILIPPDTIETFTLQKENLQVWYDFQEEEKNSIYEEDYLETKNKYGYFLDDNHPFTKIHTEIKNGKTLFVIKDSYANCFIPFLTPFYENICIVDLRYYKIGLEEIIENQGTTDILVLYNVIQFIQDFQYY